MLDLKKAEIPRKIWGQSVRKGGAIEVLKDENAIIFRMRSDKRKKGCSCRHIIETALCLMDSEQRS